MLTFDLWSIDFYGMVVLGLGNNFLFKSILFRTLWYAKADMAGMQVCSLLYHIYVHCTYLCTLYGFIFKERNILGTLCFLKKCLKFRWIAFTHYKTTLKIWLLKSRDHLVLYQNSSSLSFKSYDWNLVQIFKQWQHLSWL